MHHELKEKIRKYLAKLTSQQIQARIDQGKFPFFSSQKAECLDLAWEVLAERELKNA